MQRLRNLPILGKSLLALGLLLVVAAGVSLYAVARLTATDALYSRLLAEETRSARLLARAESALQSDGRLFNRFLAETSEAARAQVRRELEEARAEVLRWLAAARSANPALTEDTQRLEQAYARLNALSEEILRLPPTERETALRLLVERRQPPNRALRAELAALMDRLIDSAEAASASATAAAQRSAWKALAILALGAALAVGLAIWLIRITVSAPIARITERMEALKAGDHDSPVPGAGRTDEVGRMAAALETFRLTAIERARLEAEERARAGRRAARAERMDALIQGFESEAAEVLRVVAAASTELDATAGEMQQSAGRSSERAAAMAAAAEQANGNVQTVAASAEEMAASVAEVARQVADGARIASQAAEDARATDAAVASLADAARQIGEVVGLISDIAGRTNLLALNATIEAARAGEAGKGFAVVASEVKALANQTARATEQIGAQIETIQADTARAVEAIRAIGRTVAAMDHTMTQVAAAAEQQSAATREIGRAVAEAAVGTRDVSRHAAEVTEGAAQTGAAASQVRDASGELAREAERLRGRMERFLAEIRAA